MLRRERSVVQCLSIKDKDQLKFKFAKDKSHKLKDGHTNP